MKEKNGPKWRYEGPPSWKELIKLGTILLVAISLAPKIVPQIIELMNKAIMLMK